eukprot:7405777-Pyramimonas_sp.AAC.1
MDHSKRSGHISKEANSNRERLDAKMLSKCALYLFSHAAVCHQAHANVRNQSRANRIVRVGRRLVGERDWAMSQVSIILPRFTGPPVPITARMRSTPQSHNVTSLHN